MAKSSIPNAGLGAFLTFLGARRLPKIQAERAQFLLDSRPYKELKTTKPLYALHPDGFGLKLILNGEDLHSPYNNPYLLQALYAVHPKTNRPMKVKLAHAHDLYYEDEVDALKNPKGRQRIGFLGIHDETQYFHEPKRTFSILKDYCGLIDLGRYGPFRKEGK